jgi:signal transduction histidine kinase
MAPPASGEAAGSAVARLRAELRGQGDRQSLDLERSILQLHHDLRQPLATILALTSAAAAQPDVSTTVRTCLERIETEARQLVRLCSDVLADAEEAHVVRVDRVVEDVCESFRLIAPCPLQTDAVPVLASVSEVGLRRAVWNVLDNACRAAGPDGNVRVRVRHDDEMVRLDVADSGPGFSGTQPGAASMGLDIVRRFVEASGGTLHVAASDLGGVLVSIVLPAPVIDLGSDAAEPTGADHEQRGPRGGPWTPTS